VASASSVAIKAGKVNTASAFFPAYANGKAKTGQPAPVSYLWRKISGRERLRNRMTDDESIVIKPREFSDDLLLPESTDELAKFMDQPLPAIAEMITGAMSAGPKAWMVMGGRIVQSIFKAKLYQQVSREIKDLRDKGKIPEDFANEEKYRYGAKSWMELFAAIDEDVPDADRLDALKAMFYEVNKITATDSERIINYQMFQIAKRLTSGELLTLKATYESVQQGEFSRNPGMGNISAATGADIIARHMGHQLVDMVLRDQRRLTDEGLLASSLSSITTAPVDTQYSSQNGRITRLGIRFCEAIRNYQIAKTER
jgi:hypothetical protein